MKVGILTQGYVRRDGTVPERLRQVVAEGVMTDQVGLASFGISEQHFKFPTNSTGPIDVILSFVAQATHQVAISPGVVILPLHHPLHTAERWAALDVLSEGRVHFGVGKGNTPLTADVFKTPVPETHERTVEALELIVRAWTSERFTFSGRYFSNPEISLCPRPLQAPHPPISWAGLTSDAARWAGEHRVGFMGGATGLRWSEVRERVEAYAASWAGGTPIEGAQPYRRMSLLVHGHVASDMDTVRSQVADGVVEYVNRSINQKRAMLQRTGQKGAEYGAEFLDSFDATVDLTPSVFGSPAEAIDRLQRIAELGVDHVDIILDYAKHEDILTAIRLLGEKVVPALS
jgi:alkanesulfonate monooxygenase SsuD/methylene tetrahydromethanopterin reductase-like flavin-dependent oxidoreductase (luciferase family)